MLNAQKEKFSLDPGSHYINCAYMSPLLKSAEQAGIEGLQRKQNPFRVSAQDFFTEATVVRQLFAQMINAEPGRIAIIPSASYGLGVVVNNIRPVRGGRVVTVHEEFPSDVYSLHRICSEHSLELVTVAPPDTLKNRGKIWNERILDAIVPGTVLVNLSSVHWADGTVFNLEEIGERAKDVGALLVVDGTQSVGAMEMDVQKYKIDALICAAYKWLLGPYTSGFAYFSEYFDNGKPLEESWLNRIDSENFQALVNYQEQYRPMAARYNMGEFSNFIQLPMLKASLNQLLDWQPARINEYCRYVSSPLIYFLQENGFSLEEEAHRANHLFGFRLPDGMSIETVQRTLIERKIYVSLRGSAIRVSPHLYNDESDIAALTTALQDLI
jgi:selenocysteine lyase/cysteine desulfurase